MPIARHVALCILFTTSWANGWSPGVATPMPATNLNVNTSSRNDVLSFYQNIYQASENYATAINLADVASCTEGTLSPAFVTLMQRRVNYFRALSGVSASISMNNAATVVSSGDIYAASASTTKALAAQKAAMLLSRHNMLTHQPPTSLACFTSAGGNGCYFGNVSNGVYGPPALDAYMREDANNQEAGHRRWILYDSATNFATGDVIRSSTSNPAANTLYVRHKTEELASVTPQFISWPVAGYFPWQHVTEYWSLSYPGGNFSTATISVTKDGVAQTVDSINRSQGFGNNGIVWRVPNVLTGGTDASYDVTVSGIGGSGPSSYSYRITFFSADHLSTPPTLSGIPTVASGGSRNFVIGPVDIAEEYRLEVGKMSALTTTVVEGAEDATASFLIPGPVTGEGYNVRSTFHKRSGSKSLNLAFTQVSQREQWVELDRVLLPKTSATMSYYRRISYMSSGSTFVAQYSINHDGLWTDIPGSAKAGTSPLSNPSSETDSAWGLHTFNLPAVTINQPTKIRFLVRKSSSQEFITVDTAQSGAFVDDISFTNMDWLSYRRLTSYPASSGSVALDSATAGETLAAGTQYTLRLQPRVGNVWMTASSLLSVAVASNNAPTLDPIAGPINLLEDAGTQNIALTGISPGSEETQSVAISATSSNTTLIPHPTISYSSPGSTGTLHYTPAANQSGSATITVTANDGQTSNNTIARTFTVTVTAVNDPPTISAITDRTISEDGTTGNIAFTIGDVETALASLTVTRVSVDTTLIPLASAVLGGSGASRTISITPAAQQFGTGEIRITVSDGSTSTTASFFVTVLSVNDAPTLTTISNPAAINEDASEQTVNFSGVGMGSSNENQTLVITATSSNTSLIPHPTVIYTSPAATGYLRYTPVPNVFGTSVITVTVNDGGEVNATVSRTFTVTVNSVNDRPTITAIPARVIVQNTTSPAITFSVADVETAAASLTVTRATSNTTLLPLANVVLGGSGANRTVTLTPAANRTGTATVTITVSDGSLTATSAFTLTVNAQNAAPTITSIITQTINEDHSTSAISFTIGDPEDLIHQLSITTTSNNLTLLPISGITLSGSGTARAIILTPAADQFGSATVTITVSDGQSTNGTASTAFTLQVNSVNDAPTITTIPNQFINRNASTGEIPFTIGDVDSPLESLVLSATSSNLTLVPLHLISLSGSGSNRKISINPTAQTTGESTITLSVSDGIASQQTSFVLTVSPPQVSGFDAWVQETYPQLAGSAFDQDFDKDGIANGIEYAFSLDPTKPSKIGDLALNHNASTMRLIMPLPAVRDNVIYSAEFSDGLGTWSSNGMVISIADGQITATCPMGTHSRYIRWKITKN